MGQAPHKGPNVARLRARIVWLSAKTRFIRGATCAQFTAKQLASMLDLPSVDSAPDEYSAGMADTIAYIPADSEPRIDAKGGLSLDNPDRRHAAPDAEHVAEVVDYWIEQTGRTKRSKTQKRLGVIRARLKDGWSVAQLKQAVDACLQSDWHTGDNPRGVVYTDTSHIFTVERLEKWLSQRPRSGGQNAALKNAMDETERRRQLRLRRRRRQAT